MSEIIKVGLFQYSPEWEDKEANKKKIRKQLETLAQPVDLFVFPEMTLTGFSMNPAPLAEYVDGDTFSFFSSIAKELETNVVAGMIEKGKKKFFNTLLFINREGELEDKYRKIHPFTFGEEAKHYSGGYAYINHEAVDFHIGFSVCYDLRFPELFRFMALDRVEVVVNIANWPHTRIEHFKALCRARAIENQCFFIGVNRTGDEPKLKYNGRSCVYGPMGEEILMMGDEEAIGIAEFDLEHLQKTRETFPFLEDIKLISIEEEEDE
ncbi:MAG: hypothetical protein LC102_08615 [Ignavibacteriales bacterium]|nr:MAG: carbon-nitrogen family hydrolase [Ignavibacteriaceae bacterium]MBW7872754.1 carbon-nitrogen family hydrolase [Ignavibacteria bacterium]MCZ2143474.1 hypothetical protein [Ignavibacteriales bacterium]OQY76308.1 MAG: hypothetical protein B6D45_04035 [Ignavibacteriales bacterium UTCHB3]MBV6444351.1 Omega-amidase YafV [Ignavibacteriaceae bacterium]